MPITIIAVAREAVEGEQGQSEVTLLTLQIPRMIPAERSLIQRKVLMTLIQNPRRKRSPRRSQNLLEVLVQTIPRQNLVRRNPRRNQNLLRILTVV